MDRPWLPYVLPFALYLGLLALQPNLPGGILWWYPARTIVVGVTLWAFRERYPELRPTFAPLAVAVGMLAIAIWIAIDPFYPSFSRLTSGHDAAVFDPSTITSPMIWWIFVAFRIAGAVLVVPMMEELFWRAFLIRWIIADDFKTVPVGTYSLRSFAITTLLFGVEHEQWLAGLICGALFNWLLYRRKDVFSCVLAHAVSNAVLAVWVLGRGDWRFW
jgi:uncharacterized protein